jgi:hypothetical protein
MGRELALRRLDNALRWLDERPEAA